MKVKMRAKSLLILTILLFSLSGMLFSQTNQEYEEMTNQKLADILKKTNLTVTGDLGSWQVQVESRFLFIITDEAANRMRIFTDVTEEKDLETGQMRTMLEANFHTALDAKYSIWNGFVISVFTHPLAELQEAQFLDALSQVYVLSETFGTEYTSTGLVFRPDTIGKQPDGTKQN